MPPLGGVVPVSPSCSAHTYPLVPCFCRSRVLPLVCHRFHHLLHQPGAWSELAFTDWLLPQNGLPAVLVSRLRSFLLWAPQVACGLRRLKFDIPTTLGEHDGAAAG